MKRLEVPPESARRLKAAGNLLGLSWRETMIVVADTRHPLHQSLLARLEDFDLADRQRQHELQPPVTAAGD